MSVVQTVVSEVTVGSRKRNMFKAQDDSAATIWRRRASVSHPKKKLLSFDPTSESDSELDRVSRGSPNFAQRTFRRFNKKAHAAMERAHEVFDHAQETLEHVEDFMLLMWDVVSHHSLPEWLKDNEFLLSGHRPQLNSYWACFKSIFRIHTETGNIWTHLLGCVAFILCATYILCLPSVEMQLYDKMVSITYCVGAVICMGFSWLFHTLYCHSPPVGKLFSKLDYCGISVMIIASFVPWVYYSFHCETLLKYIYLTMAITLGTACIVVSMNERFSSSEYRPIRALVFLLFGCSGFIPVTHFIFIHGFYFAVTGTPVLFGFWMGFFYIVGALLYAYRIPECYWPGKFDIWGQSHQIFHVCVVIGAFINYHAMNRLKEDFARHVQCLAS